MVNRNMLPEYGACQLLIAKKKKQFSESIFLPGKSKRWVHVAGCYERGRCEKGTIGREGLFQFFGEINRIISSLSWFVSCLMIRYLFKVGKDTWFFSGLSTQVVPSFVTCCVSCVLTLASALYRCVPARWEPEARGSVWIDSNPCPREQPASYTSCSPIYAQNCLSLCIFQKHLHSWTLSHGPRN